MKVASILLVALAGTIASAQPSVRVAPIPVPTVPGGSDIRGLPFLAPGPFPATVQATKIDLTTFPDGGVLDGLNSDYVRINVTPLGQPMSGATNEGDMDVNMSLNPLLLDPNEPRAAFAFPNTNWDDVLAPSQVARFSVATGGEPAYGWAATNAAGILWVSVSDNGRDNGFTAFGEPTGTLYGHAQGAAGSFRGGAGYNMLTGNFANGNGTIFASIHAIGFATEYVIDVSYAWFPYQQGWIAGSTTGGSPSAVSWLTNTSAPDPQDGANVNWPSRGPELPDDASQIVTLAGTGFAQGTIGFTTTDLGITPASSMLFIQSGSDRNDAFLPGLVEAGDLWNFALRRDAFSPDFPEETEFASASDSQLNFIALPYNTPRLQGGKVNADGTFATAAANNNASLTKTAQGTYELLVPTSALGTGIEGGMLMLQSLLAQDGNPADPNRNFLSYEFDASRGVYVIESRIMQRDDTNGNVFLESYPLIDSPFYVAYVDFANPLGSAADCPADLFPADGGDGVLNFFDLSRYISLFNAGDPAADLAAPVGTLNFFDLAAYISLFNAGCP
jgi:hypothetical protein